MVGTVDINVLVPILVHTKMRLDTYHYYIHIVHITYVTM